MDELVVSATPLGDVLQPSQVLGDKELLLKSMPTIGETLSAELGVSSTYFGPAASRPVIRGQSGSRVQMLTDSISTLDVSDVSPDHAVAVEPLLADQVEIIRGPTTLLYGSAAAGGIVNVSDNRIPELPADKPIGGGIELRGDTAAEERAIVGRLDGSVGGFGYHLDGFTRETENVEIAGFATADPAERPEDEVEGVLANSYSESDGYAGGVSWVGSRGYLGASISRLKMTYGLPGPAEEEEEEEEGEELFEGPFLDMDQTRVDVRGEYRFEQGAFEAVRLAYGVNEYEHTEIEPSGEPATEFKNDAWQARAEAVHAPLAGWRGAFGIQFDDRDFTAEGAEAFIDPTKTEAVGLFIVEEREFGWGHLHLGARVESLEHRNVVFAPYDDDAWSLGAGLGVDIPAASELVFNLSYTERNPNAEELYSNGEHLATRQIEIGLLAAPAGSATLEKSTNVDLGWRRQEGNVRWDASVFYYDIKDYVFQDLSIDPAEEFP
ncbi:MAG: TonB-dependent receptor, partial [Gammaproteobacteria bacterium]|nr:TonB-dependent receptor [Gammaproteobacteria bacterium]